MLVVKIAKFDMVWYLYFIPRSMQSLSKSKIQVQTLLDLCLANKSGVHIADLFCS